MAMFGPKYKSNKDFWENENMESLSMISFYLIFFLIPQTVHLFNFNYDVTFLQ